MSLITNSIPDDVLLIISEYSTAEELEQWRCVDKSLNNFYKTTLDPSVREKLDGSNFYSELTQRIQDFANTIQLNEKGSFTCLFSPSADRDSRYIIQIELGYGNISQHGEPHVKKVYQFNRALKEPHEGRLFNENLGGFRRAERIRICRLAFMRIPVCSVPTCLMGKPLMKRLHLVLPLDTPGSSENQLLSKRIQDILDNRITQLKKCPNALYGTLSTVAALGSIALGMYLFALDPEKAN